MSKVNLDAMIPRRDFYSETSKVASEFPFNRLTLSHLLKDPVKNMSSIYHLLKKPDFQRETCEWSKEKIANLIKCFMERSFIPSIILWENPDTSEIYVIDGAHRLSAIIAYINDDYGDGAISQEFYKYRIPPAEKEIADQTRNHIKEVIGAYDSIVKEGGEKDTGFRKGFFDVQKIEGNISMAEDSFFKINEQGVVLSPTEKQLCKYRHNPTCIATRAVMKGGAGNQYWKNFIEENQIAIKNLAVELHQSLFEPPYEENLSSIVREHPLGGDVINAMAMVFNAMKIVKKQHFKNKETEDRIDGKSTIDYLTKARKTMWLMHSYMPGSLGLFPTIYFYNSIGKYVQSAFLGMFQLLAENEDNKEFKLKFTLNRKRYEDFLIKYKVYLTQLNLNYGSKERSASHMKWYFENLLDYIATHPDEQEVVKSLKKKYDFLNEAQSTIEKKKSKGFSQDVRYHRTITSDLEGAAKCAICKGHVHPFSKDLDHSVDIKHGGSSLPENGDITHIYCNNSKDKLREIGFINY